MEQVKFDDDNLLINALDARGFGNANNVYEIFSNTQELHTGVPARPVGQALCLISFQNGTIPEVGVNGITIESLLAVCGHRLEGFQSSQFACEENQRALDAINEALAALHERTAKRKSRGVEGTHNV